MVEVANKMGGWQKSAERVVKLHSIVSLKAAFISFCLKNSLNPIYCLPFFFFLHSVFAILKMLYKELTDRPALLSSEPPVNPRFAKPMDPSLLPPQPKRQVGSSKWVTPGKHSISLIAGNSLSLQSYTIYKAVFGWGLQSSQTH